MWIFIGQALGVWSHDSSTTKAWEGYLSSCQSKLLPKSLRIGNKDQRIYSFLNPSDIAFWIQSYFLAKNPFFFVLFAKPNLTRNKKPCCSTRRVYMCVCKILSVSGGKCMKWQILNFVDCFYFAKKEALFLSEILFYW